LSPSNWKTQAPSSQHLLQGGFIFCPRNTIVAVKLNFFFEKIYKCFFQPAPLAERGKFLPKNTIVAVKFQPAPLAGRGKFLPTKYHCRRQIPASTFSREG
jgi:hypothetical protein